MLNLFWECGRNPRTWAANQIRDLALPTQWAMDIRLFPNFKQISIENIIENILLFNVIFDRQTACFVYKAINRKHTPRPLWVIHCSYQLTSYMSRVDKSGLDIRAALLVCHRDDSTFASLGLDSSIISVSVSVCLRWLLPVAYLLSFAASFYSTNFRLRSTTVSCRSSSLDNVC